ncbi:hypothetical protein OESDEN_20251 [Oesophagostomum dentatum]|uniref:Uncharacterized protein n=1 Tax=Oesophagostomum dentatum TaxID=61180 RepID=A0A0B1S3Z8_OESDE|nr:hypothetical protein OESDEN_20251 [Oesophagostomum dentatum]
MVESQGCVGSALSPSCVQQECNTICVLPCPFNSSCVLVATSCCPKTTCRLSQLVSLVTRPPPIPVETEPP